MLFNEIGSTLKNRRESRGIGSQDVAKALKIPHTSIIAIEIGDLETLPHEVYIRRFIKGYAAFVGYSEDEIKEIFHFIEDFEDESAPPKTLEVQRPENPPMFTKPLGQYRMAQLLIVGIFGVPAYFYLSSDSSVNAPTEVVVAAKKSQNQDFVQENENMSVDVNTEVNPMDLDSHVKPKVVVSVANEIKPIKPVPVSAKIPQMVNVPKVITSKAPVKVKAKIVAKIDWSNVPLVKPGENQVVLQTIEDCWMQVTRDGKTIHFILPAGKQRDFTFDKNIQFRIANASAVTMYYNNNLVNVGTSIKTQVINLPPKNI